MATTTEIRQQYNDLLNGRYHWQQGISKFWNKNVNDAISKIGDEVVWENGGEFMTTPQQLIVNETANYTQYNEATFWNSSIIYDWESDTYPLDLSFNSTDYSLSATRVTNNSYEKFYFNRDIPAFIEGDTYKIRFTYKNHADDYPIGPRWAVAVNDRVTEVSSNYSYLITEHTDDWVTVEDTFVAEPGIDGTMNLRPLLMGLTPFIVGASIEFKEISVEKVQIDNPLDEGQFTSQAVVDTWSNYPNPSSISKTWNATDDSMIITSNAEHYNFIYHQSTTPFEIGEQYTIDLEYKNTGGSTWFLIINDMTTSQDNVAQLTLPADTNEWTSARLTFTSAVGKAGNAPWMVGFINGAASDTATMEVRNINIKNIKSSRVNTPRQTPIQALLLKDYYTTDDLQFAIPMNEHPSISALNYCGYGLPSDSLTGTFEHVNNEYCSFQTDVEARWEDTVANGMPGFAMKSPFTILFWLRLHPTSTPQDYIFSLHNNLNQFVQARPLNATTMRFRLANWAGYDEYFDTGFSTSDWQHCAMAYTPNNDEGVQIYINGVQVLATTSPDVFTADPTSQILTIGTNMNRNYYADVDMANWMYYHVHLPQSEIISAANCRRPSNVDKIPTEGDTTISLAVAAKDGK